MSEVANYRDGKLQVDLVAGMRQRSAALLTVNTYE